MVSDARVLELCFNTGKRKSQRAYWVTFVHPATGQTRFRHANILVGHVAQEQAGRREWQGRQPPGGGGLLAATPRLLRRQRRP